MMRASDVDDTVCRLLRPDGSEWRVMGLQHADDGLEVDAVRFGLAPAGDTQADRGAPALRRLEGEPLSRGDLLQWIGDGGEVLWSMTLPVDQGRA